MGRGFVHRRRRVVSEPLILGLESSCDETSAALLRGERELLAHVVLSQDVHAIYGGVVPELAARAHLRVVDRVVEEAVRRAGVSLQALDAVAVTAGPGLIGALLVGVCWGRAAAFALGKPFIPVHHMEAHLFAPSLEDAEAQPPFVGLLVSGGHTMLLHVPAWGDYELLGQTRDDAAGEAFDKVAKLLGLTYPGGPAIQRLSEGVDPGRHRLPTPLLQGGQDPDGADYFDFSFSGLKTAVGNLVAELEREGRLDEERPWVAAAFQDVVVRVLVEKTMRAVEARGCDRVLLGGGVSANGPLRRAFEDRLAPRGRLFVGSPRISLDNGAMIARAGLHQWKTGGHLDVPASADASLAFPGLRRRGDPAVSPVT
jgi:N6-L-threonylcarbamoyladenine synthase